jgi:hypothetical protein
MIGDPSSHLLPLLVCCGVTEVCVLPVIGLSESYLLIYEKKPSAAAPAPVHVPPTAPPSEAEAAAAERPSRGSAGA